MAERKLDDWIGGYMAYVDRSEPPLSYHLWTSVFCLASAVGRKCWSPHRDTGLYPNLYVMLVGPSGTRKSEAISYGERLMRDTEPEIRIAPQSTTRRDITVFLAGCLDTAGLPPGWTKMTPMQHCSGSIISSEAAVFMGLDAKEVKSMVRLLTDLYDAPVHDKWVHSTAHHGTDTIHGPCLSWVGGATTQFMSSVLDQEALLGGFAGRVLLVVEQRKRQVVSRTELTPEEARLREYLVHDLGIIREQRGVVTMDEEVFERYDAWRQKEEADHEEGLGEIESPRISGYITRRPMYIRKLMILSSLSRSDDRVIRMPDYDRAHDFLETIEGNMMQAFDGVASSKGSSAALAILAILKVRKKISRSEVQRALLHEYEPMHLKIGFQALQNAGLVTPPFSEGTDQIYTMIPQNGGKS